jgi:hypothetical protein
VASEYVRNVDERARARRLAVAEERRNWSVRYFTRDGKPDKMRRPGELQLRNF